MAGAYRYKGAVQFGPLIQFNVLAKSAVREQGVSFNKHHGGEPFCGGRLRQGPMVCEVDGAIIDDKDEIVRGYGGVAPVDEEYLESLELEKSAVIALDGLVPAAQIDPRYFQKSYDVTPDKGAEKPYMLFKRVLEAENRVAVGKVVMGGKEFVCVFRPRGKILAMEVLYWPEELVASVEAETAIDGVEISDTELKLGRQLAKGLATDFAPEKYRNEYHAELMTYLDALVAGQQPAPIAHAPARKSPAHQSLEEALAASLGMLAPAEEAKPAKKGRKAAAA